MTKAISSRCNLLVQVMSSQPCEVIKSKQGDFPKEMSELSQVTCKGPGLWGLVLKVNHSTLKKHIEMEENALEAIKTSPRCERFCLCLESLSQLLLSLLFPILIHYLLQPTSVLLQLSSSLVTY